MRNNGLHIRSCSRGHGGWDCSEAIQPTHQFPSILPCWLNQLARASITFHPAFLDSQGILGCYLTAILHCSDTDS